MCRARSAASALSGTVTPSRPVSIHHSEEVPLGIIRSVRPEVAGVIEAWRSHVVPADAAAFTREVVARAAPASKAGLSYCPSCGAAVQASWRFCANCSAPVDTVVLEQPGPSAPPLKPEVVRSSMADPLPSRSPR